MQKFILGRRHAHSSAPRSWKALTPTIHTNVYCQLIDFIDFNLLIYLTKIDLLFFQLFILLQCFLGDSLSKRQVPPICAGRTMCEGDDQDPAGAGSQLQVKPPAAGVLQVGDPGTVQGKCGFRRARPAGGVLEDGLPAEADHQPAVPDGGGHSDRRSQGRHSR